MNYFDTVGENMIKFDVETLSSYKNYMYYYGSNSESCLSYLNLADVFTINNIISI